MSANSYTFTFERTRHVDGQLQTRTSRSGGIPAEQLLEKFDVASDWVLKAAIENEGKPRLERVLRVAFVWGPGIAKQPVGALYRDRVERVLEEAGVLAIDRPRVIALLYADLGAGYRAYKVRQTSERLDGFERPHSLAYDLVEVERGGERRAFGWAVDYMWHDRGLWLGKPALIFSADWQGTVDALAQVPQVARLMPGGKAYLAPCSIDWRGMANEYPWIKPTRSRRKIQTYRSRWPTADNVKWTPTDLLIDRHGYGASGSLAAALVPV